MSKADVVTLASTLSLDQADAGLLARYYDEQVYIMGARPVLLDFTLLTVDAQQATFTFPDTALALLHVIWDNRCLDYMPTQQLAACNPSWQDEVGIPLAYTTQDTSERTFRLYPKPFQASDPFIWLGGSPVGQEYPSYTVCILHTQFVQDVPLHLELLLAYGMLAQEFARESAHQDLAYSTTCQQLQQLLFRMLILPTVE